MFEKDGLNGENLRGTLGEPVATTWVLVYCGEWQYTCASHDP